MPTPTAPVTPPPGLFDANITGLLTGQVHWTRELGSQIVSWIWGTGWTLLLVFALVWVGLRAYELALGRVFSLVGHTVVKPDAAVRVAQRLTTAQAILRSLGRAVIIFLGLTIVLSKMGVNIAPIIASAGIVGLAVGFGAQSLVKDVITGFFIIMEDQYGVGDVIELSGNSGLVERMNLRITQIRNQQGSLITIPNGQVATVINHSKEWARAVIEVGISYQESPDRVMEVLQALGDELHREMPHKVVEPVEILGVEAFKEAEIVIKLQFKTAPMEQWSVARAFRRKLWQRFQELNIELPFPQRTLWLATAGERTGASAIAGSGKAPAELQAPKIPDGAKAPPAPPSPTEGAAPAPAQPPAAPPPADPPADPPPTRPSA